MGARQRYDRFGHPNSSIDDAVRNAWEAARARGDFSNIYWDAFVGDINSRWDSEKAWKRMDRKYFAFVGTAIGAATIATYLHAYYNGLDVAPFNWILPSREVEGFERWYLENPAGASRSSGANLVAGITLMGSLTLYYATLLGNSIYKEHQSNRKATKTDNIVKGSQVKIVKK